MNVGFMTFHCQSCGHEWEWKAVFEQKPVKGKAYSRFAWTLYAKYWSAKAGGVKTKCPKCKAGADEKR